MQTKYWVVALLVVGVLSLMRVVAQWRRFGKRTVTDQDEAFIMQLRKAGVNPFSDHEVDFFFTMPDAQRAAELTARLAGEEFMASGGGENPDGSHSLCYRHKMRLIVPEMQARTLRFNALAAELGGKYDNWAVARQ
jgi:hypothetical protein